AARVGKPRSNARFIVDGDALNLGVAGFEPGSSTRGDPTRVAWIPFDMRAVCAWALAFVDVLTVPFGGCTFLWRAGAINLRPPREGRVGEGARRRTGLLPVKRRDWDRDMRGVRLRQAAA